MKDFTKVCRIGLGEYGSVYVNIKYKDGRLSITGVEGPYKSGNCRGGCGQIYENISIYPNKYAKGWNAKIVRKFVEIWKRWHLNDLQAGTPQQERFVRRYRARFPNYRYDYGDMCEKLKRANLYEVEHNGEPYKYGCKWLTESVPDAILQWLQGLPETDSTPAWV